MRIKSLLTLLALLGLALAGALAYYASQPLPLPALPYEFALKPGTSLKGMARQMRQDGVLPDEWRFVWLARTLGRSTQIKAGNYELTAVVTPFSLLQMVTKGQVTQREIIFIEGSTFNQLRDIMNVDSALIHDTRALSESEIMQQLGAPEPQAEGLFFPDTYYFANGSSDLALLKRAYLTMQQHLRTAWEQRDPGLPLESPYQALILASIVEKETGQASDRSMVAAVFLNRLRLGMMLQTDPTVIYGMGPKFDGNLRKRDLLADTPYNTYMRAGLPPTPIALPSLAALQATLHPAKTPALYFVARGDGSSEFSKSLEQHNRAVSKYQK